MSFKAHVLSELGSDHYFVLDTASDPNWSWRWRKKGMLNYLFNLKAGDAMNLVEKLWDSFLSG